jgi:hypothetical protein
MLPYEQGLYKEKSHHPNHLRKAPVQGLPGCQLAFSVGLSLYFGCRDFLGFFQFFSGQSSRGVLLYGKFLRGPPDAFLKHLGTGDVLPGPFQTGQPRRHGPCF